MRARDFGCACANAARLPSTWLRPLEGCAPTAVDRALSDIAAMAAMATVAAVALDDMNVFVPRRLRYARASRRGRQCPPAGVGTFRMPAGFQNVAHALFAVQVLTSE